MSLITFDTLSHVLRDNILPGLNLLPENMHSTRAQAMLLAIGLQESRFQHRKQIGGPAKGFWQFEMNGGVKGVLTHPNSSTYAGELLTLLGVENNIKVVYDQLQYNDRLACGIARLLLWTDSAPLPHLGSRTSEDSWEYYIRNWRPGKPNRETWTDFWLLSCNVALTAFNPT